MFRIQLQNVNFLLRQISAIYSELDHVYIRLVTKLTSSILQKAYSSKLNQDSTILNM